MKRTGAFLAVILLAIGTTARAGELDSEYGTKQKKSPEMPSASAPASPGSELDRESPDQAWFYGPRRGFFGYGGFGYGFPGFGFGFGLGYPGFGYGFGYPGFGFGGLGFGGYGFGYPGFGFGGFGFGYGRGFGGFGYGRGFGGYGFHRGRW